MGVGMRRATFTSLPPRLHGRPGLLGHEDRAAACSKRRDRHAEPPGIHCAAEVAVMAQILCKKPCLLEKTGGLPELVFHQHAAAGDAVDKAE